MKKTTRPAPILRSADDLTAAVTYLHGSASRKRAHSRANLKRQLGYMIEAAQREVERLDADFDLDRSALRNICDTRSIYEAVADVREAEMMAATVAELLADEIDVAQIDVSQ